MLCCTAIFFPIIKWWNILISTLRAIRRILLLHEAQHNFILLDLPAASPFPGQSCELAILHTA